MVPNFCYFQKKGAASKCPPDASGPDAKRRLSDAKRRLSDAVPQCPYHLKSKKGAWYFTLAILVPVNEICILWELVWTFIGARLKSQASIHSEFGASYFLEDTSEHSSWMRPPIGLPIA